MATLGTSKAPSFQACLPPPRSQDCHSTAGFRVQHNHQVQTLLHSSLLCPASELPPHHTAGASQQQQTTGTPLPPVPSSAQEQVLNERADGGVKQRHPCTPVQRPRPPQCPQHAAASDALGQPSSCPFPLPSSLPRRGFSQQPSQRGEGKSPSPGDGGMLSYLPGGGEACPFPHLLPPPSLTTRSSERLASSPQGAPPIPSTDSLGRGGCPADPCLPLSCLGGAGFLAEGIHATWVVFRQLPANPSLWSSVPLHSCASCGATDNPPPPDNQ